MNIWKIVYENIWNYMRWSAEARIFTTLKQRTFLDVQRKSRSGGTRRSGDRISILDVNSYVWSSMPYIVIEALRNCLFGCADNDWATCNCWGSGRQQNE